MRQHRAPYDKKTFIQSCIGILLLTAAMKATGGAAFALMIPIAMFSLGAGKSPEQLIFILLLSISSILGNGYLMPKNMIYGLAQRGLFVGLGFVLMTQVAGRKASPTLTPLMGIMPYVAYMALVSVMGWCPMISYLKLFLFTTIFMAYYAIAIRSSRNELDLRKLRSMILAVASFFILGSFVAQRFGWAYVSFEELQGVPLDGTISLYKGLAANSNALGCILMLFSLTLFVDMLFSVQRVDYLYLANILCALYLVAKSGSRTAMGTLLLSAGFAFYCFLKTRTIKNVWKGRVMNWTLMAIIFGGSILLASSAGREKVMRFIVKNQNQNDVVVVNSENVLSSRQGKIDEGFANWRKSPLFGNGFQVSDDMKGFKTNGLASILSAPVEKCVWFAAVLEEGGVIGFGLFCLFLLTAFTKLIQRKAYIGATMLFSILCSNLGEFTFFSLSGAGGMQWGMVFVGLILDNQRLKDQRTLAIVRQNMAMEAQPPWAR